MADYRRHYEDDPRRQEHDRDELDEVRPWFDDGTYRTSDRGVHERFREGRSRSQGSGAPLMPRERGGYWRLYEGLNYPGPNYAGLGPKDYQRSDDRVREDISDCMTDDPLLDASEITVEVKQGVVTLCGSVTSREQKRRAEDVADRTSGVKDVSNQLRVSREPNGHNWAADSSRASGPGASSQPVTQASGKGSPSKSSDRST